tara:strand:+ start:464 stop:1756 length:1293 start_codon:yes stop_codon:yes gene_type:complete
LDSKLPSSGISQLLFLFLSLPKSREGIMQLIEVTDKKTRKDFLDVARIIYKNDKTWVCPLDIEINNIFDPKENTFYSHGDACRWILKDNSGNLIGRVAAFINEKKANTFDQPTGGMGFFECIDNQDAAFKLFDQAKKWLSDRKMEAMDGPINFGENDVFWGLLVDGFTHPGYGMQYNPPYYQALFEAYGFEFYFEQVSNHLDMTKPFPERFAKIANWVMKKPGYEFKHLDYSETEKFVKDFVEIYNDGWQFHENFSPMDPQNLRNQLEKARDIIDPRLIWFAYVNEEPAAFIIMFPDANQVIKHMNGKLNWWSKLKFFYYKNIAKVIDRGRVVIMGCKVKYQKSGVESGIFISVKNVLDELNKYKEMELSWVGDFNPKMRQLHESVGAVFAKKHITYRKLFDESKSLERSSIIAKDTREQHLNQNESDAK